MGLNSDGRQDGGNGVSMPVWGGGRYLGIGVMPELMFEALESIIGLWKEYGKIMVDFDLELHLEMLTEDYPEDWHASLREALKEIERLRMCISPIVGKNDLEADKVIYGNSFGYHCAVGHMHRIIPWNITVK